MIVLDIERRLSDIELKIQWKQGITGSDMGLLVEIYANHPEVFDEVIQKYLGIASWYERKDLTKQAREEMSIDK